MRPSQALATQRNRNLAEARAMTARDEQGGRARYLAAGLRDGVTQPLRVDARVRALMNVASGDS